MIKINKKKTIIKYIPNRLFLVKHNIKGIITTNSTSKIKKITAIKKKCLENGIRGDLTGSNPHSNGDDFSRSIKLFIDNKYNNNQIKTNIINNVIDKIKTIKIILFDKQTF